MPPAAANDGGVGDGGTVLHALLNIGMWLAAVVLVGVLVPGIDARVAGKVGYSDNYYSGKCAWIGAAVKR